MSQTLLAFLAMMVATLIAFNQYQGQIKSYGNTVHSEYEIMANAVAIEQMEIIDATTDWADLESWDGDTVAVNFSIDALSVPFEMGIDVQFVDDNGDPSVVPTTVKEVLVVAMNDRFRLPLVTHSRLISQ